MKPAKPIVITGFMGCSKSKVARELARRSEAVMVDLDDWITAREGRTPAQIFTDDVEPAFRTIESNALRELLQRGGADVIALGGGAWIEETNRSLIAQYECTSVWLDVPFEICWNRIVTAGEDRPLGRTREQAESLYNTCKPIYALAQLHITISADQTLDDLVSTINHGLHRLNSDLSV